MDGQHLDIYLGALWDAYGPPQGIEKNAGAEYFYKLAKPARDEEALGPKFCKLASAFRRDPWDLALEVIDIFDGLPKVASMSPSPKERELAQFYLDWSQDIEKRARLGGLVRAVGGGLARGAKALAGGIRSAAGAAAGRVRSAASGLKARLSRPAAGPSMPPASTPTNPIMSEGKLTGTTTAQSGGYGGPVESGKELVPVGKPKSQALADPEIISAGGAPAPTTQVSLPEGTYVPPGGEPTLFHKAVGAGAVGLGGYGLMNQLMGPEPGPYGRM